MNHLQDAWDRIYEKQILDNIQVFFSMERLDEADPKGAIAKIQGYFKQNKPMRIPVNKSSCISYIMYNPNSKILRLTFRKSGRRYEYSNVSKRDLIGFVTNGLKGSLGQTFRRNLRQNPGKYPYKEV
jgi:hypothetical protein